MIDLSEVIVDIKFHWFIAALIPLSNTRRYKWAWLGGEHFSASNLKCITDGRPACFVSCRFTALCKQNFAFVDHQHFHNNNKNDCFWRRMQKRWMHRCSELLPMTLLFFVRFFVSIVRREYPANSTFCLLSSSRLLPFQILLLQLQMTLSTRSLSATTPQACDPFYLDKSLFSCGHSPNQLTTSNEIKLFSPMSLFIVNGLTTKIL